MKEILSILSKKFVIYGVVIVLGAGVVFVFLKNGTPKEETMVVHPGNFVQQVSVSGKVVAAQDVDLGFSQSGRVSRVNAKVGDIVKVGSLLAEIENGDLRATVMQKQAALESEQAKLQALKEGTRPEELAIAQSTVDSSASALVNAIMDAYTKSDDAVRNKVDQFMTNPASSPKLIFLTNALQAGINAESDRLAVQNTLTVWQKDNASLSASSDVLAAAVKAQKNLAGVSALLADANTALSQAAVSQSITQTAISGYVADIVTARTAINSVISTLNSAAADLDSAQKNLALKLAGSTQADISSQVAQVKVAQADLGNAQAQLVKTLIFAPFTGVVTKMDAKVGQIISPNTTEVSMIGSGAFQVEGYVAEINVALVKVGNPAVVTLDAYGSDVPFDVKVVSIDPAETIQDGVSTYRAVFEFNSQDPRIKSGMTANILITTQEKENVISVPQKIVINKDGQKFVKVKDGEGVVEKKVTTDGVSSLGQIEITSGLKDGDVVILEEAK
jgi:HlyD family secretion protein